MGAVDDGLGLQHARRQRVMNAARERIVRVIGPFGACP